MRSRVCPCLAGGKSVSRRRRFAGRIAGSGIAEKGDGVRLDTEGDAGDGSKPSRQIDEIEAGTVRGGGSQMAGNRGSGRSQGRELVFMTWSRNTRECPIPVESKASVAIDVVVAQDKKVPTSFRVPNDIHPSTQFLAMRSAVISWGILVKCYYY